MVHEETVRSRAREGLIPAAKRGNLGGFRFRRDDLDRFLEVRRSVQKIREPWRASQSTLLHMC